MPVHTVVLVHNDPEFAESTGKALQAAGYETVSYADTMSAINALDELQQINMIITRLQFPPGQPTGVALGRMARVKRPGVNVLFVGQQEKSRTCGRGLRRIPGGAGDRH